MLLVYENRTDGIVVEWKKTVHFPPHLHEAIEVVYDIRICDSPKEMEHIVIEKNRIRNRARILAGYCWNWPKDTRNDVNYHDIKIGDYGISWNLDGGDAFAINPDSVHEAGCIHTSQGLEFDYVGVIIGDDMRHENGEIVTDYSKRAKTDQSMKGCYVYCTDSELAAYLKERLKSRG